MHPLIAYVKSRFNTRRIHLSSCILAIALCFSGFVGAAPVQFSDYFVSHGRLLEGSFIVTASLIVPTSNTVVWTYSPASSVKFSGGQFAIEIPSAVIPSSVFSNAPLILQIAAAGDVATFPISATPFSIHTDIASYAKKVEGNSIKGTFKGPFIINGSLNVTSKNALYVQSTTGRVGILNQAPLFALDVDGYINATQFTAGGADIRDRLPWRVSPGSSNNIYTVYPAVAVGSDFSLFALNVSTTLNASEFLLNGRKLSASQDWLKSPASTANIYLNRSGRVGIGTAVPAEALEIRGGVRIDITDKSVPGTIRFASVESGKDFQGYTEIGGGESGITTRNWGSLTGFKADGRPGRLAVFMPQGIRPGVANAAPVFYTKESGFLGVGGPAKTLLEISGPTAVVAPYFNVVSTLNQPLFSIVGSGDVGVWTNAPSSRLSVGGVMNAQDLYVNGTPIRLSISKGTFWLRNNVNDLYYLHGNVGLGRPDPMTLLDIAAPNRDADEPTKNPAVTFTSRLGLSGQSSYTLGISAKDDGVFRVERGTSIGSATPLFVAFDDRFGVGLRNPKANLHVQGDSGLILSGAVESGVTVDVAGAGTRLTFHPGEAAFRAGSITVDSPMGGAEWNDSNIGLYSVAMGLNPFAGGNFSAVIGGDRNQASGAYSTIIGGQLNKAQGDFSLAMGRGALALHHGVWVWADGSSPLGFSSVTENQVLIRATKGVGIGTSSTFWEFGSEIRYSALTVAGLRITPTSILGYSGVGTNSDYFYSAYWDSIDWSASVRVFNDLVAAGYIDSSGILSSKFRPGIPLVFASGASSSGFELGIREMLESTYYSLIFNFIGDRSYFAVSNAGGVGIGMQPSRSIGLLVSRNMSVNSPAGSAILAMQSRVTSDLLAVYFNRSKLASPSMMVSASSNIGIGRFPDLAARGATNSQLVGTAPSVAWFLDVEGKIYTNVFSFPDGQTLPTHNSAEVWQWERTTPNIFFPSANVLSDGRIAAVGNVGVGTTSPNFTLELSNRSSLLSPMGPFISPVLTYDLNNTDLFSIGVSRFDTDVLRIFPGGESSISSIPPLSIYNRYIGIRTTRPRAELENSGKTAISGQVRIKGFESAPTHTVSVSKMSAGALAVRGSIYGWPSIDRGNGRTDIYWNTVVGDASSFVGIGQTVPEYSLDVAGTINVVAGGGNSFIISDEFRLENGLTEYYHYLRDSVAQSDIKLYVDRNDLVMDDSLGQTINISKVLTSGSGPKGFLAEWAIGASNTLTILAEAPLLWVSPVGAVAGYLVVTAPVALGAKISASTYTVSHNWSVMPLDGSRALGVVSHGTYDGDISRSGAFNSVGIYGVIDGWPNGPQDWNDGVGPTDRPFVIKGQDIVLNNSRVGSQPTLFTKNGTAYGLSVDVSDVTVQEVGDRGYRFPAIFMPGARVKEEVEEFGVGIGVTPSVELDVRGTVISNFFKISKRLEISTINVENNGMSIYSPNRVGIGLSNPSVALEVVGSISSIGARSSQGVIAQFLNTTSGGLVVTNTGLVGVGLSTPVALFDLYRQFGDPIVGPYSFYNVEIISSGNNGPVLVPVTGVEIALNAVNSSSTTFGNRLGSDTVAAKGYGVRLNLAGLALTPTGTAVGIDVKVSDSRSSRNATVFIGGNVGIGVSNPTSPLEVKGTIFGTDAPSANFLQQINVASFNRLIVPRGLLVLNNVIAAAMVVTNDVRLDNLVALNDIELGTTTLNVSGEAILNTVSVNMIQSVDMVSNGISTINMATFNTLGVGQLGGSNPLSVVGGMIVGGVTVNRAVYTGLLVVNTSNLVVGGNGRVGVNVSNPLTPLQVMFDGQDPNPGNTFDASLFQTWNGVVAQNPSSVAGVGVGVLLVPDTSLEGNIGSGVVALGDVDVTNGSERERSHHLLFITDPDTGLPMERMRLTRKGNLGIGTSIPDEPLAINGGLLVSGRVSANELKTSSVVGTSVAFEVTTNVQPTMSLSGIAILRQLSMKPIAAFNVTSGNFSLFSNASGNVNLATFQDGSSLVANFGERELVLSPSIPFFSEKNVLDGTLFAKWDSIVGAGTQNVLSMGQTGLFGFVPGTQMFQVLSGVSSTTPQSSVSAEGVSFELGARTTGSSTKFVGIDVLMVATAGVSAQDVVVGVSVGVSSDLKILSYSPLGQAITGRKIAAVFSAGASSSNVLIVATSSSLASLPNVADMYILNKEKQAALRVSILDSDGATYNKLIVSRNGDVGINSESPVSPLSIVARSGDRRVSVMSAQLLPLFDIDPTDNVGIGTSNPSVKLQVVGTLNAAIASINGLLTSDTIGITTSNLFVVLSNGYVGMGTSVPAAQHHLKKSFNLPSDLTAPYSLMSSRFETASDEPAGGVPLDSIGLQIVVTSNSGGHFGQAGTPVKVSGLNIDLSGLNLHSNSVLYGVKVVVATSNNQMKSALFMGGGVGIGISNPQAALEVGGTLGGGNVILTTPIDWSIAEVTANRMFVSGDGVMDVVDASSATVSVTTLEISADLVNSIPGSLMVPIITVGDLSSVVATFNRLVIPTFNADMNLGSEVIANALIVSGSAVVNDVKINDAVTVNTISVSGQLNIVGAVTTNRRVVSSGAWAAKTLGLKQTTTPNATMDAFLWVDNTIQTNLIYVNRVASVTANISSTLVGSGNRMGYFNTSKQLSSDAYMDVVTVNTIGMLRVGTDSSQLRVSGSSILKTMTQIPTISASGTTVYAVDIEVGARSQSNPTTINAMSVKMGNGDILSTSVGDTAAGVIVEFAGSVSSSVTNRLGGKITGSMIPAVFMSGKQTSGNVVIVTSPNISIRGLADLYIATVETVNGRGDFVVQSTVNSVLKDLLIVSNNGSVGVGSSVNMGTSRLVVNGIDGTTDTLGIYNSGGAGIIVGPNRGVVIGGTTAPSSGLWVNGQGKATTLKATGGIVPKTIDISGSNGGLVVTAEGNVGIGTTAPAAQLELSRSFLRPGNLTAAFTMETVSVNTTGSVTGNITAVEFVATSAALTTFGDSTGTSVAAVGMNVDGSELALGSNGVLTGIYISPTTNVSTHSLILNGGNVGIGTTLPTSVLDISGDLAGNNLWVASADFDLDGVTVNELVASGSVQGVSINGLLLVDNIAAGPEINVSSTLRFRSGNGVTINLQVLAPAATLNVTFDLIATLVTANQIAIGSATVNSSYSLAVSGNGLVTIGGNLSVSGSVPPGSQVTTNELHSDLVLVMPTVRFMSPTVNVTGNMTASTLRIASASIVAFKSGYGVLSVAKTPSSDLLYVYNGGPTVSLNITRAMSGTGNVFPYYGSDSQLTSSPNGLNWTVNGLFRVVSVNAIATPYNAAGQRVLTVSSNIGTTNGSFTGELIKMDFGARTTATTDDFAGMSIVFPSGNVARAVADRQDIAVGLRVDLTKIYAKNSTELPLGSDFSILGQKAAAIFLVDNAGDSTGNVGIFLKDFESSYVTANPNAVLHVSDLFTGKPNSLGQVTYGTLAFSPRDKSKSVKFAVGGLSSISDVLVVGTSDARVSIGTPTASAALHVKALASSSGGILDIKDSSNRNIMSISSQNRVGIGTDVPSATLHILGDGSSFAMQITSDNAALGGDSKFLVDSAGRVGIRTISPVYALDVSFNQAVASPTFPFRVSSGNDVLIVSRDGEAGVYVTTTNAGFFARVALRAGTGSVTIPGALTPTSYNATAATFSAGILAVTENRYLFVGVTKNGQSADSVLSWLNVPTSSVSFIENGVVDMQLYQNRVSIGTVTSDALLTISGSTDPILKVVSGTSYFIVNSAGVGIGTSNSTLALVVSGNARISSSNGQNGSLFAASVSTNQLVAKDTDTNASRPVLTLTQTAPGSVSATKAKLQRNYLTIDVDYPNNVIGMSLGVTSSAGASFVNSSHHVVGVNVDVASMNIFDPITPGGSKGGLKYPALFTGGQVAIGSTDDAKSATAAALLIQAMDYRGVTTNVASADVIRFVARYANSTSSNRVALAMSTPSVLAFTAYTRPGYELRVDYGGVATKTYGIVMVEVTPNGTSTSGMVVVGAYNGVSTSSVLVNDALYVSGDVRLGVITTPEFAGTEGWGSRVYLSGGPTFVSTIDSDNKDPMYIGRYNIYGDTGSGGWSELRMAVGEGNTAEPNARLLVGYTQPSVTQGGITANFSVAVTGYIAPENLRTQLADDPFAIQAGKVTYTLQGGVGIGTANPVAALHVVSINRLAETAHTTGNHTVLVTVTNNVKYGVAVRNLGNSTNSNFVSFIANNRDRLGNPAYPTYDPEVIGSIEGDGSGGVQFTSPEADYAEYVDKLVASDSFQPGDVVSVDTGKVSFQTSGRHKLLVISSAPVVAGNWQADRLDQMALTSFMGQVPVKVIGPVNAGDYLVPSGRSDGTAMAISSVNAALPDSIIGQAWESSRSPDVKKVKALIGFPFRQRMAAQQMATLGTIKVSVAGYREETSELEKDLMAKVKARANKIAVLKLKMAGSLK